MTQKHYSTSLTSEQQPMHLQNLDGMRELTNEELTGVTGGFGLHHPHWEHGHGHGHGYGRGVGYGYGHGYGYGGFR